MEGVSPTASQSSGDSGDYAEEASRPRAYHSKRPHKKSRAGCTNCKHRKVKCDEAHPVCRACSLRNEQCVYVKTSSRRLPPIGASRPGPSLPTRPRQSSTECPPSTLALIESEAPKAPQALVFEPFFRPYAVEHDDMKLLWFYTASTCKSFNSEPNKQEPSENILRVDVMQHAFDHRFLLDTVLALSSLHAECLDANVNRSLSLSYRGTAIKSYTKAVEAADPDTFPALLVNSLLMTALASADFRDSSCPDLHIIGWMMVWRGIGLMIQRLTMKTFLQSNLCRLFYRPPVDLEQSVFFIPDECHAMVADMQPDDMEYVAKDTYMETLTYLGSLYMNLHDGLSSLMKLRIITWFTFIPARFAELARHLRPRALVILAHYAAFLKLTQGTWWLVGIGDRTLGDLIRHLPLRWHKYMMKPIEVSGLRSRRAVGRVLTGNPNWELSTSPREFLASPSPSLSYVDDVGNTVSLVGETVVRGGPQGETSFNL